MLLSWIPVPGTTTPEPEPVDAVSEAALGNRATAFAKMRRERSCQIAAIEVVGAVLREPLERAREIGHHEPVARDEPVTVAAVDHLSLACVAQDQIEDRVEIGLRFRQLDALPRVANRR